MRHAAAIPACAVLIGAGAGTCWPCPPLVWWTCLIAGWIGLACALLTRHRHAPRYAVASALIGFTGASGMLSSADAGRARRSPLIEALARLDRDPTLCGGQQPGGPLYSCDIIADLEGRLCDDASTGEFGVSFALAVDRLHTGRDPPGTVEAVEGAVRVTVGGDAARAAMEQWRAGRRIRAPVFLRAPLPYRNFGVPDQRDRLALAGTGLFGSIKSASLVDLVSHGSWWDERAADVRAWTRTTIARHVRDPTSAAIIIAVLIGDRAGLSPDVEHRLQRAGTFHVIAISGGNIAILAGLLLAALRVLWIPSRLRLCLTAAMIVLYALVIDAGPSVVRATIAAVAYLLARAVDVEARGLGILTCVVLLMLLATPLDIVNAGFWLTCGATLGILLHASPLAERVSQHLRLRRLPPRRLLLATALVNVVVTTLCAELMLLPIAAFVFSQITFAGLALNIAAIPLMTVVQITGIAVLACDALPVAGPASAFADSTGWIAQLAAMGIVRSAALVDVAPWMAMRVAPPPLWIAALYLAAWCAVWIARLGPRLRAASAAVWSVCLALMILAPPMPYLIALSALSTPSAQSEVSTCTPPLLPEDWRNREWLKLTMLDVGQGGAAVIETSTNDTLLVDTGGTASAAFDIGTRIVSPALWALGLRRLDALALTHGDIDHIGGALAVVDDFAPRALWSSAPRATGQSSGALWRAIATKAAVSGASLRALESGDRLTFGPTTLRILNPARTRPTRPATRNDESLVIDVRFADVSIVLPGDIGAAVEHRLAHEIDAAVRVPIRVLAAPHHGSRSSSTAMFLDALAPRAVLISAGLNNRHGHPAPATLDRYRSRGIDVFRTDLDGAIQLLTDGHAVHIVSCSGRRARIQRVPRRSGRFRQRRSASVSMPAFGRVTNGMMR